MGRISQAALLDLPASPEARPRFRSARAAAMTESVIREMSRVAHRHKAINLAQGFPDFEAPPALKAAACDAINRDINQYPITWGAKPLRDAIAAKYRAHYGLELDPEREITVCCGATECMIAALMGVTDPGDEIIVFEPFYENYGPDSIICGATRRLVKLHAPDWTFDPDELRRAFSPRTKAIILNTPNNPTGRVFERRELEIIAGLCQEFDTLAITDEIYEHIVYDGAVHVPIMTLPGMRDRAVTISSLSKTYTVTGWRVGWVLASPDLSDSIRKIHDFLTVGAAAPLQAAGVTALSMPPDFYAGVARDYQARRDMMLGALTETGFHCHRPRGAYYIMTDISGFGFPDDMTFMAHMAERAGVVAVPGSCFFGDPAAGAQNVRFCFCKKYETLEDAIDRLKKLAG
ncbi:MAG TPA: aminotransferase class I/II-fold pyridoxal phosphate-dependent enzyme [Bryobacteraceae bacterium]|nr:aminotransferase class I/II-fold pyridoxal phosphate-dependent enzyme [Bryobacteraceae bacterium]